MKASSAMAAAIQRNPLKGRASWLRPRIHRHPVPPAALGEEERLVGGLVEVLGGGHPAAELGDAEGAADLDADVAVAVLVVGDAVAQLGGEGLGAFLAGLGGEDHEFVP